MLNRALGYLLLAAVVAVAFRLWFSVPASLPPTGGNPRFITRQADGEAYIKAYSKSYQAKLSRSEELPPDYSLTVAESDGATCEFLNFECDFGELRAYVDFHT